MIQNKFSFNTCVTCLNSANIKDRATMSSCSFLLSRRTVFGKVFSNVIVKDRCPHCNGNLVSDVYTTELTCLLCSRSWTPAQIQQFKLLTSIGLDIKGKSPLWGVKHSPSHKSTLRV